MIQFDNGPPDGDYARYIDGLNAQRLPTPAMTGDGFRVVPQGSSPPVDLMMETGPQPGRVAATSPSIGRLLPAQAAAAAAALLARDQQTPRPTRPTRPNTPARDLPTSGVQTRSTDVREWFDVAGVVAGIVVALIGFFVQAAGPILLIAGIGIVVSMVQRILRRRGVIAQRPPGRSSR